MFQLDWSVLAQSKGLLFEGMWVTLKITLVSVLCGLAWGTVLAMFAVSKSRLLNYFSKSYVSLFRSIPLVMLLLWFFLIVPQFLKALFDLSPSVDIRLVSAMVAF